MTNVCRLNNMLWSNYWVNEEIRKIKKYSEKRENKDTTYRSLWDAAKVVLRGKFIVDAGLPQKTTKISNKQSNLTPKETRKIRTKPKFSRRK